MTAAALAVAIALMAGPGTCLTPAGGGCKAGCAGQCRAEEVACLQGGGAAAACRAQMQICARRCVVNCAG